MHNQAIIVTNTGRSDCNQGLCLVAMAAVSHHNQGAEFIKTLGEYPEQLAWEMAALLSGECGLPIRGPGSMPLPRICENG